MRPNPIEMTDFSVFTINGKVFPATEPLVAKLGDRVRIRIGNLSAMDHHPIHVHGLAWKIVETDGGPIPEAGQWPETTVLVAVGQTRTVEFVADNPGDWAMHCHMSHHTMTQMGHNVPNLIGVQPGEVDKRARALLKGYMTMGDTGMAGMGEMGMPVPRNSAPMVGGPGKHGYIDMGGMLRWSSCGNTSQATTTRAGTTTRRGCWPWRPPRRNCAAIWAKCQTPSRPGRP